MKKILKSILLSISLFAAVLAAKAQATSPTILTSYFALKDALVADNSTEAQVKAKALLVGLINIPVDQQKNWKPYMDKLLIDSRHISESTEIDHQREYFASLSKNMLEAVKGLKLNITPVYAQYCPMKKATWLSESVEIKNPYYGRQMLTCGKVAESLNK
ncbi:DUF3347 domain-containing protein [Mucilaginibacter sp. SMC90]|uniref:DUF3347 domain-containing protein n=1 Tax=Mucilaginibacter TaxID=423349 RepID=UPI00131C06F6|nr:MULTISPECIES: DUF3347 domain-containing protein [unclassified Mucilaginibacter]MBS7565675.1 DUF3347 domain-containing protein [Mucilaginibacter sp. Bleaf8]UOE49863.1 DUF3347 domain-containing protein [Mucilaginibacter sp. SMC90]